MSRLLRSSSRASLYVIGLILVLGCSKSPEQYGSKAPPQPDRDLTENPATIRAQAIESQGEAVKEGERAPLTAEENNARKVKNHKAPVLYGVGAANITVDTTYSEAQDILTDNPVINGTNYIYDEGIVVAWRLDDPRTPNVIFVLGGYEGKMDFPAPWNEADVGDTSFASAFSNGIQDPNDDPKALNFIRSIYNHLEGTDVDCIAIGQCRLFLNEGGNTVVFQLPKAYFLFGNNERRILIQISLFPGDDANANPGLLRNPIDLLQGKVQVPTAALSEGELSEGEQVRFQSNDFDKNLEFGIGDTFETIIEQAGLGDVKVTSAASSYQVSLGQGSEMVLLFEKTDYNSPQPLPTDRLDTIVLYANYNLPLKFASKFIRVDGDGAGGINFSPLVEVVADDESVMNATTSSAVDEFLGVFNQSTYLQTQAPYLASNFLRQKSYVENLIAFMKSEGDKTLGVGWESYPQVSGRYDDRISRELYGSVTFLNPSTREGKIVELSINETNGDVIFATMVFTKDFQKKTYFAGMKGMTAGQDHLMGFKLGDIIYATDFSYGNSSHQATVRYEDADLGVLTGRVAYTRKGEASVAYENGEDRKIIAQNAEVFSVNGADLGANLIGEVEIDGKTWKKYEINVIESAAMVGEVRGLCGLSSLNAKIGMYDLEFQSLLSGKTTTALREAADLKSQLQAQLLAGKTSSEIEALLTESQKELMNYEGCPFIHPTDAYSTGLKRSFYFPNHNLKLVFSRRELAKVGIYKQPSNPVGGVQ